MDEDKRRAVRSRLRDLGLPDVDDRLADAIAADVERLQQAATTAACTHDLLTASPVEFVRVLERLRAHDRRT